MAFSSKITKDVKEKAAFKCCRCQSIGVEVHHIISQKNGGPDTMDNAAPLCPNCHTSFGDNPIKHKEITMMRDWWYKVVENLYPTKNINYTVLNDINSKLEAITDNQDKTLIDLKSTLKAVAIEAIEHMTAGTAVSTATVIANASIAFPTEPLPYPTDQEIEQAGDYWMQLQADIARGK